MVRDLDVSCLRMSVPENEGQHAQSVYSPALKFGGQGRFAFSAQMQDELHTLTDHAACRTRILADWSRFVVGTAPVLLEKSPPNLTKIWWLRQVFPGARFVVLTRDPRAVSASTHRRMGASLPELMMHWNTAYSLALRDADEADTLWVRYEDIVADQGAEIARIAAFADLPRRPVPGPIDPRFGTLANSNQKYLEAHECRFYGQGVWDRFGYSV